MNVLGIGYQGLHDSSACLIRDGELLFAVAEERLSRVKHDSGFPARSIKACLDYAGLGPDDLDYVCFGWSQPWREYLHDLKNIPRLYSDMHMALLDKTYRFLLTSWHRGGMRLLERHFGTTKAKVKFVQHHLAHAISAYAFSGFREATVAVMDGSGAWESTSVWYGADGQLEPVTVILEPNSIGHFYLQFTKYLGFQFGDEWKVMGLAPYGQQGISLRPFIHFDDEPYRVNPRRLVGMADWDVSGIEEILGPRRVPESPIEGRYKDIAFAVQEACERAMLNVVRWSVDKTGCRNLCLAGGVALNSKANGKILHSGLVDDIFIQPAADDEGTALGAALAAYLETEGRLPLATLRDVYFGDEYSDAEIQQTLKRYKVPFTRLGSPAQTVAELLADGKIVGYFQGRMEFGPRALGSRSILADCRDHQMKDKVNDCVKFREWWRPFAPSLLAEAASDYLEYAYDSPFMILTFPVKPGKTHIIPAVTHVDGTTRPQTVKRDTNPAYWQIIKEFEKRTGVPVIMNTSFNLRGEPIVRTPTDAIRTFFSSGMDALVMGDYLVTKA